MNRRKFLERAGLVTVASTAGAAGCLDVGLGGDGTDEGDGSDGGSGGSGGSGGDGESGDGADGGGDGSDGSGDGGMTATPTSSPTPAATMASSGSIGEGTLAPYDVWASPSVYGSGDLQAGSVDLQTVQQLSQTGGTPTPTPQGTQTPTDPIVGYSLSFLLAAAFSGFVLAPFNLGDLTTQGASAERINLVGDGLVFEGSYDIETLEGRVAESQASESGTYEGYTLYSVGSGDSRGVVGVSSDALVHASAGEEVSEPRAIVEAAIDAGAGNASSYGSQHAAYEALVTALPTQPIMGLMFSPDGAVRQGTPTPTPQPGDSGQDFFNISEFDLEGDLNGFASGLGFDMEQQSATARMALRYASAGEVDGRDLIRSQAAPQANDVTVRIDGSMVLIAATYAESPNL